MRRCEFCGSELPVHARFCGNCGSMLPESGKIVIGIATPPEKDIPDPQTPPPPHFSSPSYPNLRDTDPTLLSSWSRVASGSANPQFQDRQSDENKALLPDFLLPGMMAMQGQMPSSATAPAISPAGSIASTASAHLPRSSRRRQARWVTACRRP